ncbi:MAG TPA: hypothetical protein VJ844_08625 [Mucilaginibacter sp.]|nr:hypothetical protein [Mucilaginibacter sp.]
MEKSGETICTACGTKYPANKPVPEFCTICIDDRQYIPESGQDWTDAATLSQEHTVKITEISESLFELIVKPKFAIGQRAFLVLSPGGNILWDCIPLLTPEVVGFIQSKGGLKAIVFSHPHYYSNMDDWADKFGCPVYIHEKDSKWIMIKGKHIELWTGYEKEFWDDIRAINIDGHFPGSCLLHVPAPSPKGVLFVGDSLYVAPSKRHVAVMHSYPNQILLPKQEFLSVFDKTKDIEFDAMYGAFEGQTLTGNAREIFQASMQRYLDSYGT